MRIAPGSKLGPYEVLSLLGAGGMGEVYRARDPRLGRDVAIKVLPAERMADDGRRRRFVQEARAASALNHPNIVTIHDIESADGIDFIVMEYVPGQTLDALIPKSGMRMSEVLRTTIQIADALAAAHSRGIGRPSPGRAGSGTCARCVPRGRRRHPPRVGRDPPACRQRTWRVMRSRPAAARRAEGHVD